MIMKHLGISGQNTGLSDSVIGGDVLRFLITLGHRKHIRMTWAITTRVNMASG